jgi:hypothetical protein
MAGNNGIKQLPLLVPIIAQEWGLDHIKTKMIKGHCWKKLCCNNDLGTNHSKDNHRRNNDISARMTHDATKYHNHISARTIYVMWPEECLWNVGVLQRVEECCI